MIEVVRTRRELKRFVLFTKRHYQDTPLYVQPFFGTLIKELKPLVLKQKTYVAIVHKSPAGMIDGRLLYTFANHQKHEGLVCFFGMFEAVDDQAVADELFAQMETEMRKRGVRHAEGTFTPYDPDTRRGILVEGFEWEPTIFTSYHKPYYKALLEGSGFVKAYDTVSIGAAANERAIRAAEALGNLAMRRFGGRIDPIDLKHPDKDIEAIHAILKAATTEANYQNAPSIEMIRTVAKEMGPFLEKDLILIAREKDTGRPVGFTMCLPDYNQLFKKMNGRLYLLWFLWNKHKITRVRGMLQYVVPEYQGTGLLGALYAKIYEYFPKHKIADFEAGTILEDNLPSLSAFSRFGLSTRKIYRIYGKDLPQ
jgi:GNAT superfamily N-acetyltransferase